MTNKEMMNKMVAIYGFEAVVSMAETVAEEIKKNEEKYKYSIPKHEYAGANGKKPVYPAWVDETLEAVTYKLGTRVVRRGSGESRSYAITNGDFAKWIINNCNDDGITLMNIIEILSVSPAWSKGRGFTQAHMELVFHILVLHKGNLSAVKEELKSILKKEDPNAMRVHANDDDDFRGTLDYDAKMTLYAEKHICEKLNETARFMVA